MVDELHLMLRITDVLINNLVLAAITCDYIIISNSTVHLDMLERIHSCGITFRVTIPNT